MYTQSSTRRSQDRSTSRNKCWTSTYAVDAVDAVPIDPNVRVSESQWSQQSQPVVNLLRWRRTQIQLLIRLAGAAPQPDMSQAQPMEVSLEQRVTTEATKRTAETQLTPDSIEGCIGVEATLQLCPVLDVKVTTHFDRNGILIKIDSLQKDGSQFLDCDQQGCYWADVCGFIKPPHSPT